MARRIKFSATCFKCGARKGPGQAWLTKIKTDWKCQCDDCYKIVERILDTKSKTAEPANSAQHSAVSVAPLSD